jgi:Flp pilus assembly protein TadD
VKERARCRETGWYHESRARRALDRGQWEQAERHARLAIRWDQARAASYVALADALLGRALPDHAGARAALETAAALEPANPYVVGGLVRVCEAVGDIPGAETALRRALAAGAPVALWAHDLVRLMIPVSTLLATDARR